MEYFGGAYVPGGSTPPMFKKPEDKKVESHWAKKIFFWFLMIFFTVGFVVTLSEIVLRIVPGQWSNTFFHVYDPVLGTWHISSHTGDYIQADFKTKGITINSFGMRDKERSLEKSSTTLRVAVLGDSFVEAFHVADEETFTRLMEAHSEGKVEVLNFGVAGFGTTQEYLAYKEKVRQFHPDIVILAFLSSNDMRNNSRALEDAYTGVANTDRPFVEREGTSSWKIVPPVPKPSATNPLLLFVKKHFTLYRFLWYSKNMLQAKYAQVDTTTPSTNPSHSTSSQPVASTSGSTSTPAVPQNLSTYIAQLFAPPHEEPFTSAWEGTEWSISMLKQEVEKDGAKFVLVTLPDATKMEKDAKSILEKEYDAKLPKDWDIDYPEKRLSQFAKKEGILFLDLTPGFRKKRDEMMLASPFFSYPHDGHWAPLGHQVAADLILNFLSEKKLGK
jgi:hypothetical protein